MIGRLGNRDARLDIGVIRPGGFDRLTLLNRKFEDQALGAILDQINPVPVGRQSPEQSRQLAGIERIDRFQCRIIQIDSGERIVNRFSIFVERHKTQFVKTHFASGCNAGCRLHEKIRRCFDWLSYLDESLGDGRRCRRDRQRFGGRHFWGNCRQRQDLDRQYGRDSYRVVRVGSIRVKIRNHWPRIVGGKNRPACQLGHVYRHQYIGGRVRVRIRAVVMAIRLERSAIESCARVQARIDNAFLPVGRYQIVRSICVVHERVDFRQIVRRREEWRRHDDGAVVERGESGAIVRERSGAQLTAGRFQSYTSG